MKKVLRRLVKGKKDKIAVHEDADATTSSLTENNMLLEDINRVELFRLNHAGGYHIDLDNASSTMSKLHYAAWVGQLENVLKYFKTTDINIVDDCSRTALHLAVAQGNLQIVQSLLENGANMQILDNDGLTPFLKAVEIGNMDLVHIFLNHRVNLAVTDNKGNTALHLAVLYGFRNIVSLLLHTGAARDVINKNGDTPLHIATQNEYLEVVDILLRNGANYDTVDLENRTPMILALKIKNVALLKLFKQYGACCSFDENKDPAITEVLQSSSNIVDPVCKLDVSQSQIEETKNESNENITQAENDIKMSAKEEDSQVSMQSCIIPPPLTPPRSWDIIQSGIMDTEPGSDSIDGTLGRNDTMKEIETVWETNNIYSMDLKPVSPTSPLSLVPINFDNDILNKIEPLEEPSSTVRWEETMKKLTDVEATRAKFHKLKSSLEKINANGGKNLLVLDKSKKCDNIYSFSNEQSTNLIAKSRSLDVVRNGSSQVNLIDRRVRCKSLTTPANVDFHLNSAEWNPQISKNGKYKIMSSQLEPYDKALEELSLEALSNSNRYSKISFDICKPSKNAQETLQDLSELHDTTNVVLYKNCDEHIEKSEFESNPMENVTQENISDEINPIGAVTDKHLSKKRQRLLDMRDICDKSPLSGDTIESDDSSSDDDPPFWTHSSNGGFFSRQNTVIKQNIDHDSGLEFPPTSEEENLRQYTKSSSSSDEDTKPHSKVSLEASHGVVYEHLKQITKEKGDLEDVASSLMETAEKLKYDLTNSNQALVTREDGLITVTKQLMSLDTKYLKTMEQMTKFSYHIKNLEQEVSYLVQTCQKESKNNQYLLKQIKYLIESNRLADEQYQKLINQHVTDIQKLQSDVIYWQKKFEEVSQKLEEEKHRTCDIKEIQADIMKMAKELNLIKPNDETETPLEDASMLKSTFEKLNEKLQDCVSKDELRTLQNEREMRVSQMTQQAINQTEDKLCATLMDVKNILQLKFEEQQKEELEKSKREALLKKEFQNCKQKYLLEISKLSSIVSSVEEEKQKLREQRDALNEKIEKSREEKRRQLIEKSFNLNFSTSDGSRNGNLTSKHDLLEQLNHSNHAQHSNPKTTVIQTSPDSLPSVSPSSSRVKSLAAEFATLEKNSRKGEE